MQTKPERNSASNAIGTSTMALLFLVLFTLTDYTTAFSTQPGMESSSTFKEGVPGGVIVDTVKVSAKVTAIEAANRKVTLLGPNGDTLTVKVGPEAANFDQVRVGDMVNATVTKELVVFLDEEGASVSDGSAAMVSLAPKGAQPGGVVAATTQVTATIKAIDPTSRTATLQFDGGSAKTFPVRDDIDLSRRKVGEKVVFQVIEMIAISVEKQ